MIEYGRSPARPRLLIVVPDNIVYFALPERPTELEGGRGKKKTGELEKEIDDITRELQIMNQSVPT